MANTASPEAIVALFAELGITPQAVAEALGTSQVTVRKVADHNVNAPASRKQRVKILGLTGVYPNDTSGFKGITKSQASNAIDALLNGKSVKVGRKTLKPRA